MRQCIHGRFKAHYLETVEPSYSTPARCGGSPDNWFVYKTAMRLHRWWCRGDAGALVCDGPAYLRLATPEDMWVLPVGMCCRDDAAQRYASNEAKEGMKG